MIHTGFGIKEILHTIIVLIVFIIVHIIIYIIYFVTFERGSGHNITKRKYRRIIKIMKCKIWLYNHFPNLCKFLGWETNFIKAKKYFSHHVM